MSKAQAFSQIYNDLFDKIFSYVRRRIPSREHAEDVVSETFISLWKVFDSLEAESAIRPLVFTIARRRIADFFRNYYKIDLQELTFDEQIETATETQQSANTGILEALITKLNERDQQFITLRYKQNLKLSEVADQLEISVNNAKVLNNRLIKRLKKLWTQTEASNNI